MLLTLPETTDRLRIDGIDMYLRAVEVVIQRPRETDTLDSEVRTLPLRMGDWTTTAEVVNFSRMLAVSLYLRSCRKTSIPGSKLVVRLHLAPEFADFHTMFIVEIVDGKAKIELPNPTGPKIAIARSLSIESI